MRFSFAALSCSVAFAACSLDWNYPETGAGGASTSAGNGGTTSAQGGEAGSGGATGASGGEGGSGANMDVNICCLVCQATTLPETCGDSPLRGSYNSDCPVMGWAHEVGMCFEFKSCACENCDQLPQSEGACMALVHNTCNDCTWD